MAILLTCTQPLDTNGTCPAEAWQEIQIDVLTEAFTLNMETMELGFMGMLLLFCTGLGVGLIIAHVRKLRAP